MKSESIIVAKIQELKSKLEQLDLLQFAEMKKKCSERDYNLLKWIWTERMVHKFAIDKLRWVLDENHLDNEEY